ncbi:hypothetical protein D3C87_33010 [compost metagenome]
MGITVVLPSFNYGFNYLIMRKSILLLLLTLLSVSLTKPVFSQDDEERTMIGSPNNAESTLNVVADNFGNTYVGGKMNNKGLLVKQNSLQVVQWSKTLTFTSNPADEVSIGFLDVVGDTVFGCGKIHQVSQGIGSFYFKMNAQTGTMYWAKYETSGPNYFSTMRYANGKFFLVGGNYLPNTNTGYCGRVTSVSSQNGNVLWQTNPINLVYPSSATNFRATFLAATEMVNGKMFITGAAEGYNMGTLVTSIPFLIGISETGNIFLNRCYSFPTTTLNDYVGAKIEYDSDLNLVMGVFSRLGSLNQPNSVFIKCDTNAIISYARFYRITPSLVQFITELNVTATGYVIYGFYNSVIDGMYAMKIAKNGNLEKCVSIFKPNSHYIPLSYTGLAIGNGSYVNGRHYFPATENTASVFAPDINQIILDENLDFAEDCSELTELFPTTFQVGVYHDLLGLAVVVNPSPLSFSNGGILVDQPLFEWCSNVTLDLQQSPKCVGVEITAEVTGFSDPTFYWSNGTNSTANSIYVSTTDTVFVRVLDTKCCELIDTIVPVLVPLVFTMNLPADTTICLQPGNSYQVTPTFSGETGTVHYLWSNNSTGSSLAITSSGTYWVDVTDSCSTKRDSISVLVNSLPVIGNTGNITVCEDDFPATLNPVVSGGGSVLWDDGTTLPNRIVNGPGTYTISATNSCGTVSAVISVSQSSLPDVQIVSGIDSCIQTGTSIVLIPTFSNATDITWSDGSTGTQLSVSSSGSYTVYASSLCGVDSATYSVTINYFPQLDLPAMLDTCFEIGVGFAYTAQGSVGSYQWSSGSQSATEWISQEETYSCTLTNVCGSITDSMQVRRVPDVDLYFPEDSISDCQRQLSVSLLHIETNYNLEILAPYHGVVGTHLTETGWYTVHAFNKCWHKWDSIYVNLQNEQFYLPNSFTPNGDSHNERYEFEGENVEVRSIRIFNRWGEEIFSQSGDFTGWDGTCKGENCPDGMYAVSVIYEDCFGIPTEFKGHVNLLR